MVVLSLPALALCFPKSALADPQEQAGKIVMMLNIVAKEYREGVRDGKVVNADEYGESQVFLSQAKDRYGLIADHGADSGKAPEILGLFGTLAEAIQAKKHPAQVAQLIDHLKAGLIGQFKLQIRKQPLQAVSLENGRAIYQKHCVGCHGPAGGGDGPDAAKLDPPPARLADPQLTGDEYTEPYDNFQIISVGIANTAMRAWSDKLSEQDRWDVTYYIRSFANPNQTLPVVAEAKAPASAPEAPEGSLDRTLSEIARLLQETETAYRAADATGARLNAMDAYLIFERIEPSLINKDKKLGKGLERTFGTLQGQIKAEAPLVEIQATLAEIRRGLARARGLLEEKMSWGGQFLNSLAIIVREGFEAILIIAALIAFLVKSRNEDKVACIWVGVGAALAASFLTAWVLESVLRISSAGREQMEAWIMLVAVAMLFWVSYWLVSKVEAAKWQAYITGKMKEAIGTGSSFTLGLVAFISVYREGFETILFYKALYINAGEATGGIVPGFLAGSVVLAGVYFLIYKAGIRIPVKWFFVLTSVFLVFMAFLFMGRGLHELQMGGALSMTPLSWAPEIDWLGMYPTLETLIGQSVLLVAYAVALVLTLGGRVSKLKTQTS